MTNAVFLCLTCCFEAYSGDGGLLTLATDATRSCACTSPGSCSSLCSTNYCVMEENAGVNMCNDCVFPTLAHDGQCYAQALEACGNQPACRDYVECRAWCTDGVAF